MSVFAAAILNELHKLKRTLALWLCLLLPLAVVLLMFLLNTNRKRPIDDWSLLSSSMVALWAMMVLPLFVALMTALINGVEHRSNGWRRLYALPLSRTQVYFSKLFASGAALLLASLTLMIAAPLALELLQANGWGPQAQPIPWHDTVLAVARSALGALVVLCIQHWVSMRWGNFVLPLGLGVVATMSVMYVASSEQWWRYDPWTYGLVAAVGSADTAHTTAIGFSLAGAVLISLLGCWETNRRDIA